MRSTMIASLAATALITGSIAGCTEPADPQPPSGPGASAPAPAQSATPVGADEQAVRDEVLNRYRGYNDAYTRALLAADPQDEELVSYLETPLKQKAIAFLVQTKQHGAAYRGQPQSQPTVIKVDLTAKAPTAVVSDCYDATDFRLYFTKNNKPVPIKSGPRRYIIETTATRFDKRGWLFTKAQSYPDRTC